MINHSLPQYTITIDYIIRGLLNTDFEHTLTDAEIKEALPLIFDFDYGIDSQYKMFFEYSFIRHYLFREIAVTPFERWKQYLQEFCYANYKYIEVVCKAAQTDFNPLETFSYTEDGVSNRKTNEQSNSTGNTENETTNTGAGQEVNSEVNSAFPQATLNDMDYASGATQSERQSERQSESNDHSQSSGTNTINAERDATDDYTNHIERKGNQGVSYSDLLSGFYRNSLPLMWKLYHSAAYLFFSVY